MTHFNGDRWSEFTENGAVDRLHASCQYIDYKTLYRVM
jgi:hypothetical protein